MGEPAQTRRYHARLPANAFAGLSAAGLMLPEAVAYAAIAGLPAMAGLTAAVIGGLAYLIIGQSRTAIISPTSSAAVLLAASVAALSPSSPHVAAALTIMVGLIFIALALLQAGSFAGFISRPVLRGFAFGLAITIVVGQLPHIAGVYVAHGSIVQTLAALWSKAAQFSPASIALGLTAIVLLVILRRIPSVPATLIVLFAGIAAAALFDLPSLRVQMAPPIDVALPHLGNPFAGTQDYSKLVQLAVPIAFILFAESWTTIRNLALRSGDSPVAGREIAALGLANIASGLAQGMPVGAGFSIGSANAQAGARSRLAAAISSLAILLVVVAAPGLISRIPMPVLSAIVVAALLHALSPAPLQHLWTLRRDVGISVLAASAVLALGVLDGMLIAIALSVALLLRRFAKPYISQLGGLAARPHDFVDLTQHPEASALPGIAIFRPNAPLFFANAEAVLASIRERAESAKARTLILSLEETDDLDSTAIDALNEFAQALGHNGCTLILARLHDRARAGLELDQSPLAKDATFSVADAVQAARLQFFDGDPA